MFTENIKKTRAKDITHIGRSSRQGEVLHQSERKSMLKRRLVMSSHTPWEPRALIPLGKTITPRPWRTSLRSTEWQSQWRVSRFWIPPRTDLARGISPLQHPYTTGPQAEVMRSKPRRWYNLHTVKEYHIDDCYQLNKEIEKLIQKEHLKKYVKVDPSNPVESITHTGSKVLEDLHQTKRRSHPKAREVKWHVIASTLEQRDSLAAVRPAPPVKDTLVKLWVQKTTVSLRERTFQKLGLPSQMKMCLWFIVKC